MIRTADVDLDGDLKVTAGATLVRDSDPAYEVAETHAKAGGILSAFGLVPAAPTPSTNVAELVRDEDVLLALNARNRRLSRFWLTDQGGSPPGPAAQGQERGDPRRRGRLREHAAPRPRRARHDQRGGPARGVRPGHARRLRPGDRRARARRPARRRRPEDRRGSGRRSTALLAAGQPFLAVCLGHQALCHRLGIPLAYKDIVFQGTQSPVEIDGRTERVGFYNTFVGRAGETRCRTASRSRPIPRPATSTWCAARTTAASSSTPSRSSPSTATTCSTTWSLDLLGPSAVGTVGGGRPPRRGRRRPPRLLHLEPRPPRRRVTGVLPRVVQHDEVDADEVLRALPRRALARARPPGDPADFAVGREVLRRGHPPGARRLPRHAGPGHGVRRPRRPRSCPAHGEVAPGPPRRRRASSRGVPQDFRRGALPLAGRGRSCPTCLAVTATCAGPAGAVVMGVRHRSLPLEGVQFHPESILSEHGAALVANFLGRHCVSTPADPAAYFREVAAAAPALLLARRRRRPRVVGPPLDHRLARATTTSR